MTEEDFLKRWSRRKREVSRAEAEPPAEAKPPQAQPDARPTPEAEFDPASLPPIESINALTDVTAFLRDGVPAELTRAALRRVWTADPAIRDFVGLAENAWDFTDPNAMPGFGPLESTAEVRQMIAKLVDQIGEVAKGQEQPHPAAVQSFSDSNILGDAGAKDARERTAGLPGDAVENHIEHADSQVLLQGSKEYAASQRDPTEDHLESAQSSRRSHGGALPR